MKCACAPPSRSGRHSRGRAPPKLDGLSYSVVRHDPPRSAWESVNIGIILADPDTGSVHRRLLTADEAERRSAEAIAPRGSLAGLLEAAGARGGRTGDPAAALRDLHSRYGNGDDVLRVAEPRALSPPSHAREPAGAAEWLYESLVSPRRHVRADGGTTEGAGGAGEEARPRDRREPAAAAAAGDGAAHPAEAGDRTAGEADGRYTFAACQYVPDAARDEPVNFGVAMADSASRAMSIRHARGGELAGLGRHRFDGLWFARSYERRGRVDDVALYMREIAEPDVSSVRCTAPRPVHAGGRPEEALDRLFARLVAPAPRHDGSLL